MQANPISDGATGNLGRVQGARGFEDWIRKLWRLGCGSLVDRRRGEGQEPGEGEREILAFLPPALHVVDGWRSRGLATGDSIIFLVNGQGTPKEPLASSR